MHRRRPIPNVLRPTFGASRRGHAAGFTLVEALSAGIILAVSAVVIGSGVSQAVRSQSITRDTQRAAELLDQILTKIDLIGPSRLLYEGPTEGQINERFSWQATIEPRLEADLYEVSVKLRWQVPGYSGQSGARVAEAHTMLNDPPRSRNAFLEWDEL